MCISYILSKEKKLETTDLRIVENKDKLKVGTVLGIVFISFIVIFFILFYFSYLHNRTPFLAFLTIYGFMSKMFLLNRLK